MGSADQILTIVLQGESKSFWVCSNPTSTLFPATLWLQKAPDPCAPLHFHTLVPPSRRGTSQRNSPHQERGNICSQIASTSCVLPAPLCCQHVPLLAPHGRAGAVPAALQGMWPSVVFLTSLAKGRHRSLGMSRWVCNRFCSVPAAQELLC